MSEQRAPYHVPATGRGGNHSASHSELLQACESYLRWHGAHPLRIMAGLGQRKGSPDIIAAIKGRCLCIDAKTGKAIMHDEQLSEKAQFEAAGALFVVVHQLEDLEDALVAAGLTNPALQRGGAR